MPMPQLIIDFYKNLPASVDERTQFVSSLNLPEVEALVSTKVNLTVNSMKALDQHVQPSKALFMHMTNIENAIRIFQRFSSSAIHQEQQKVPALKRSISEALIWFKQSFIGRLYSEIDAHTTDESIGQACDAEALHTLINQALMQWVEAIDLLAGNSFPLPEQAKQFNDAQISMCRVSAAHDRMSLACQDEWLSKNALYAIHAFRGKVNLIQGTASSLERDKLVEFRNLYQRFQPFLLNAQAAFPVLVPSHLDSEICYALEGKNSMGEAFSNDDNQASTLLKGLGPLAYFKPNEQDPFLVQYIKKENKKFQNMLGNTLSNNKHRNAEIIRQTFKLCDSLEHNAFCSETFASNNYQMQSLAFVSGSDQASSIQLYAKLKDVNRHLMDLMFFIQVMNKITLLFSNYSLADSHSISRGDKNQIKNYLFLISSFIGQNSKDESLKDIYSTLSVLLAFINDEPQNSFLIGDDCILKLEQIQNIMSAEVDKTKNLKEETAIKLRQYYDADIALSQLIEGRATKIFTLGSKNLSLSTNLETIKAEIDKSIHHLSGLLQKQMSNYKGEDQQIKPGCSQELSNYFSAIDAFALFNESAKALARYDNESQIDLKANYFSLTVRNLEQGLILINKLNDSSVKTPILTEQLEHYGFLLQSFLPGSFNGKQLTEKTFTSVLVKEPLKLLPFHWKLKLEASDEFLTQYFLVEKTRTDILSPTLPIQDMIKHWANNIDKLQEVIDDRAAAIKGLNKRSLFKTKASILVDLLNTGKTLETRYIELLVEFNKHSKFLICKNFWAIYLPKLLSLATTFEIENNLEMGALVNGLYDFYQKFHLTLITDGINDVSIVQHYDLESLPFYCITAQKMAEQSILVSAREEVALEVNNLESLTNFLEKLKTLHAFYFRDGSLLSRALLEGSTYLSFAFNFSNAQYLNGQREIREVYRSLYKLLNNASNEFPENYLSSESNFSKKIVRLIAETTTKIDQLTVITQQLKLKLCFKESLLDFYQKKTTAYLQEQAAVVTLSDATLLTKEKNLDCILNSLASQIIDEHFTISIKEPYHYVHYKRKGHLLSNEKVQFAKKQFVKESMDAIWAHKVTVVKAILHNDEEKNKSGAEIKAYITESLKTVYDEQIDNVKYYIKLDRVKKLVENFREYLIKSPQWYTENEETVNDKLGKLDRLESLLLSFNALDNGTRSYMPSAEDRFNKVKKEILGTDKGEAFKKLLTKGINPNLANYNEVIEFIAYWCMRLFRALVSIVKQSPHIDKREEFVSNVVNEFKSMQSNRVVEESEEEELSAVVHDESGSDILLNLRSLFWQSEPVGSNEVSTEASVEPPSVNIIN